MDRIMGAQTSRTSLKAFLRFMLARAQEPSSWRGAILALSGVAGIAIEPALALHIISAGVSIAGLIGILTADKVEEPPAAAE
jgi:hypothetical protein